MEKEQNTERRRTSAARSGGAAAGGMGTGAPAQRAGAASRTAAGKPVSGSASRTTAGKSVSGSASRTGASGRPVSNRGTSSAATAAGRSQATSGNRTRPVSALDGSAYAPSRTRQAARRRRQRQRRRRQMTAVIAVVILLAGGGAFGARQAYVQKHQQEYADQGIAYLENQDYAQAITAFDDAIALTHGRIGTFESQMMLYRAETEYRGGDYQAALKSYETLYGKDNTNETYKTGLALCLLETGDYDQALTLGVIQGQIYNRKAKDQINAGNYDDALSTIETGFAEAGADDVGRKELLFNQAVAWEYKGDYKKALEILEDYDQKYTAEGNAARELAFLKTRQGNH